jgi:putative oxidoreductase
VGTFSNWGKTGGGARRPIVCFSCDLRPDLPFCYRISFQPEVRVDFFNRLQPFALLVLRLVLGAIMIAHGYHKVFGGFHHHMEMVRSLGIPSWMAYLSTGTEFFGGIGIVLGLFTRFFSLAFIIEMGVAIWKVHFKNGLIGQGGYEFPLSLVAIAFALVCFGGGPWGFNFGKSAGGWAKTKKS